MLSGDEISVFWVSRNLALQARGRVPQLDSLVTASGCDQRIVLCPCHVADVGAMSLDLVDSLPHLPRNKHHIKKSQVYSVTKYWT